MTIWECGFSSSTTPHPSLMQAGYFWIYFQLFHLSFLYLHPIRGKTVHSWPPVYDITECFKNYAFIWKNYIYLKKTILAAYFMETMKFNFVNMVLLGDHITVCGWSVSTSGNSDFCDLIPLNSFLISKDINWLKIIVNIRKMIFRCQSCNCTLFFVQKQY